MLPCEQLEPSPMQATVTLCERPVWRSIAEDTGRAHTGPAMAEIGRDQPGAHQAQTGPVALRCVHVSNDGEDVASFDLL
jgi:hypothetical protein